MIIQKSGFTLAWKTRLDLAMNQVDLMLDLQSVCALFLNPKELIFRPVFLWFLQHFYSKKIKGKIQKDPVLSLKNQI